MLIDKIIFKVNAGTATTPTCLIIAIEFSLLNIDFFAKYSQLELISQLVQKSL